MSVIQRLKTLSAAEEFFDYLQVPYDPARLRVVRLHVLKQLGSYLEAERLEQVSDEQALGECRQLLVSAYGEFVEHSPLDRRLFKVLREASAAASGSCETKPARALISLARLKEGETCTS